MPGIRIQKVQVLGLTEAQQWLDHARGVLEKPRDGLAESTHAVALLWRQNFEGEGSMHGTWKALADNTNAIRVRMGFPAEHPILQRTGQLLRVGVGFFENAKPGETAAGDGITAAFGASGDDEVELSIAGRKTANQRGGGRLPARQFWVTTSVHESAAAKALQQWLEEKVDE